MAVEGTGGQSDPTINFLAALAFSLSVGIHENTFSVMVGQLYKLNDYTPRWPIRFLWEIRSRGGTILVGYLGEAVGLGYGFGLAGRGMLWLIVSCRQEILWAVAKRRVRQPDHDWTLTVRFARRGDLGLVQYQDVIRRLILWDRAFGVRGLRGVKLERRRETHFRDPVSDCPDPL